MRSPEDYLLLVSISLGLLLSYLWSLPLLSYLWFLPLLDSGRSPIYSPDSPFLPLPLVSISPIVSYSPSTFWYFIAIANFQIFVCIKEQKLCTLLSSFKKFGRNCFIWKLVKDSLPFKKLEK